MKSSLLSSDSEIDDPIFSPKNDIFLSSNEDHAEAIIFHGVAFISVNFGSDPVETPVILISFRPCIRNSFPFAVL